MNTPTNSVLERMQMVHAHAVANSPGKVLRPSEWRLHPRYRVGILAHAMTGRSPMFMALVDTPAEPVILFGCPVRWDLTVDVELVEVVPPPPEHSP